MSKKRKCRQLTVEQKTEVVHAGLRGDRSVRDVCRECESAALEKTVTSLERSLGRKTYELDVAGGLSRDWT